MVPLPWLVRMDAMVQRTGNWWQLTPSVFVRAKIDGDLSALGTLEWRCPECGAGGLVPHEAWLQCQQCQRRWSSVDGIYDFKTPLE